MSEAAQTILLPPAADASPGLLPARMLNEFACCPRLCYLEWVQGEFADNVDTVEGRVHHRTVGKSHQRIRDGDELTSRSALRRICMCWWTNVMIRHERGQSG